MDPMQIVRNFLGKGGTPQQMISNFLNSGNTNPMLGNLIKMAQSGNPKAIETFARNICNERGINFDKEYANFMNQLR